MSVLIALGIGAFILIRLLVEEYQIMKAQLHVLNERQARLEREREIAEMKKRAEQEQQGEQK
jgi:hypothetical protein